MHFFIQDFKRKDLARVVDSTALNYLREGRITKIDLTTNTIELKFDSQEQVVYYSNQLKPLTYGENEWVGFDLDGTLAEYTSYQGIEVIGDPIEKMVTLMLSYYNAGFVCKIFTARASVPESIPFIKTWLLKHQLPDLEITCKKELGMLILYDDRAVRVEHNKGILCESCGNFFKAEF